MAEALGLVISIVIGKVLVVLSAVVPGKLEESLTAVSDAICLDTLLSWVAEEVQIELGLWVLNCAQERHAQSILVEVE